MSTAGLNVTTLEARLIAAGVPSVVSYLRGFMTRGTLTPAESDRAVDIFYEWGRTYLTFTNHWSYMVLLGPVVRAADVRPRLLKGCGLPNDLVIIVCHFLFPSMQHHMIRRWTSSYAAVRRHDPLRTMGPPLPAPNCGWRVVVRQMRCSCLMPLPAVMCHATRSFQGGMLRRSLPKRFVAGGGVVRRPIGGVPRGGLHALRPRGG